LLLLLGMLLLLLAASADAGGRRLQIRDLSAFGMHMLSRRNTEFTKQVSDRARVRRRPSARPRPQAAWRAPPHGAL
jgi:hypothetical protein